MAPTLRYEVLALLAVIEALPMNISPMISLIVIYCRYYSFPLDTNICIKSKNQQVDK